MRNNNFPLANRLNSTIIILTIPPLSAKKRKKAALIQLSSLYPVSLAGKDILLFKNGTKKNSWICMILPVSEKGFYMKSSTLYVLNRCKGFSGKAVFVADEFNENFEFNDGAIVSSYASNAPLPSDAERIFLVQESDFKKSDIISFPNRMTILKRSLIFTLIAFSILFATMHIYSFYLEKNRLETREKEKIEIENKRKITEQKKLKEKAEALRKKYENKLCLSSINAYESLSVMYSCIGKSARIESMSIEGSSFQLDIHSTDGASILSNFETQPLIESIRMSRSAREQNKEFVTYSGTLRRQALIADECMSDGEKIAFYEEAIRKLEESEKPLEKTLSEYIQNVRAFIKAALCMEEYMQLAQSGKFIQIECMLKGNAASMFSFLKTSSQELDFRSVRIRNAGNGSSVSMVIKLDSHIESSQKDMPFVTEASKIIEPNLSDINRSFYKASSSIFSRTASQSKGINKSQNISTPQNISKQFHKTTGLEYVGTGGSSKTGRYIFFKDKKSGELYKLPVMESGKGDWCKELSFSSYEIHLKGEIYEVKK